MNTSGIKLEGWDEFLQAVQKLPDNMKKNHIAGLIRKNMKPVAEAIKAKTPERKEGGTRGVVIRRRKDGSISTASSEGNLKRSIGVKTFGKGNEVTGYAGLQKGANADGWYGFFLERGTKYISKRPFIAPAAAISVPAAAENLANDAAEYIVKNAQKLGLDAKLK